MEPHDETPTEGAMAVGDLLRSARAVSGMSQRDLSRATGVPKSTIARIEADASGARTTVAMLVRLLAACGIAVVAEGVHGRLLPDADPERDRRNRRYPPHLDPHPPMQREEWWAVTLFYQGVTDGLIPWPSRTFIRESTRRTARRRGLDHPWDARFWRDTVADAPNFTVHPALAKQRDIRARTGAWPLMAATPNALRRRGWHWMEGSR